MINPFLQLHRKVHKKSDDITKAKQNPVLGIAKVLNLHYANDANNKHLLDIFYPKNTLGLLPTIIEIHGGGWVYGDKELNEYQAMYFASLGFTVININYRLSPEVRLNGQVQDVFDVFSWVEQHGKDYHVDLSRVFLTGDSAGGHLALLTSLILTSHELQKIYEVKPQEIQITAIAVTCPVALLREMLSGKDKSISFLKYWMFGPKPLNNPISKYASIDDVLPFGILPDTMIVTTSGDRELHRNSVMFDKLLTEKGIKHTYRNYESEGNPLRHVFNVLHLDYKESKKANDDIAGFFKSHFEK